MRQNIIAILILTFCISYNAISEKHTDENIKINEYSYPITKIIDGDTVELEVDFLPIELGKYIRLRIYGIDTPELHGQCIDEVEKAKKAKKFLADFIKAGKKVTIILKGKDKYFRLLGDIMIDGKLASSIMIESKHAIEYKGTSKKDWCNLK